jgi:DNA-binding transcriptional regulator YiaG
MGKNEEVTCPACGSSDLELSVTGETVTEPYSEPVVVSIEVYKCRTCGMEGDFSRQGDEIIGKAIEAAKHNSIVRIIEEFTRNDMSMSSIERALDLPQRTLTKWKNSLSVPSAAATALMNVIRTYPWILTVAQHKYDPLVARNVCITNAISEFLRLTPIGGIIPAETGVFLAMDSLFVYQRYERTSEEDTNSPIEMRVAVENNQGSYFFQGGDLAAT